MSYNRGVGCYQHPTPLCTQSYREIPLTRGQVALVDAEDYETLAHCKWWAQWHPRTKTFYAVSSAMPMHRHILGLRKGDGIIVDHINHDTLDNRRANIRIATRSQNMANRNVFCSNKCGFKGVYEFQSKWRAAIQVNNRRIYIGSFDSPELAHEAYKIAALDAFKEFANF